MLLWSVSIYSSSDTASLHSLYLENNRLTQINEVGFMTTHKQDVNYFRSEFGQQYLLYAKVGPSLSESNRVRRNGRHFL